MAWYEHAPQHVLERLNTDPACGLATAEVARRQEQYGKNQFDEEKPESVFKRILHHLKDAAILILLLAVALSLTLAITRFDATGWNGFIKPIVIFAIVVMNITLAITQEASAEKSLAALAKLSSPSAKVIRDGVQVEIDAVNVVPGDIIVLETGDLVPADARLLEVTDLSVDEASLTGESEPSEKELAPEMDTTVALGDQKNMVFSSCLVTSGRGRAVIVEIGMKTEIGKIAGRLNDTQKIKTPLQQRLDKLNRTITLVAVIAALLLVGVGFLQEAELWTLIFLAVALAVAAVPEMMALITTLTLAHGVKQMVKKNALIRKLPAVETLGSTSVICSDKTGTLTQNRMTIKRLWLGGDAISDEDEFSPQEITFIEQLTLSSNAVIKTGDEGEMVFAGSPTEAAILRLLVQKGLDKHTIEATFPRVGEVPFSSERKMMTTVHKAPEGGYLVITKGAMDRLPFSHTGEAAVLARQEAHDAMADKALRVIGMGRKHVDTLPENLEELETDLDFVGIIGLIDPPRPEAKAAITRARKAGIRTVMITGDHAATAKAIATDLGIIGEGGGVMTGVELAKLSDEELIGVVTEYSVYARVSPEDKIRIVEAWQEHDEVVAMTGDGVNDAPALKAADVGIAMGITGTEVSKSAADMILIDDNFATIVDAVQEGRNVFSIIKKLIYFLIVANFAEVTIILGAFMFGWGAILSPIMILLVNVLADGIPGLRLAQEVSDPRIMNRAPIGRMESFFGGGLLFVIAKQAISFVAVTWVAYYVAAFVNISSFIAPSHQVGQTAAFVTLGFVAISHIFTARTRKSMFKKSFRKNFPLTLAALSMYAAFVLFAILPPFQFLFELVPMGIEHWLMIVGLAIVPTIVAELGKLHARIAEKKAYRKRLVKHFPHEGLGE
ncbi:MAG: cation-translocating P-type ATPase [Oscillospiraceae bacterium]|nr:cation-translocating P-type ATPase [Oscillospiraceae bacterium]